MESSRAPSQPKLVHNRFASAPVSTSTTQLCLRLQQYTILTIIITGRYIYIYTADVIVNTVINSKEWVTGSPDEVALTNITLRRRGKTL